MPSDDLKVIGRKVLCIYMKKCFPGFLFTLAFMFCHVCAEAQVLVHQEPRHKPVFENERIRILEVKMPPGDTSQYHIHQTPSLFIFLSSSEAGSQLLGEKAIFGKNVGGRVLYEDLAPPHVRTHRVWNLDKDTFRVIDIELLFKDTGFMIAPLSIPALELEIDNGYVRAYRKALKTEEEFSTGRLDRPLILVSLDDFNAMVMRNGKPRRRIMKTGEFMIAEKDGSFFLKNESSDSTQIVLIELPVR